METIITKYKFDDTSILFSVKQNLYMTNTNRKIKEKYVKSEFYIDSDCRVDYFEELVKFITNSGLTMNTQEIESDMTLITFYLEDEIYYISDDEFNKIRIIHDLYPNRRPVEKSLTTDFVVYDDIILVNYSNQIENSTYTNTEIKKIKKRVSLIYDDTVYKAILSNKLIPFKSKDNITIKIKKLNILYKDTPLEGVISVSQDTVGLYNEVDLERYNDIYIKDTVKEFNTKEEAILTYLNIKYKLKTSAIIYDREVLSQKWPVKEIEIEEGIELLKNDKYNKGFSYFVSSDERRLEILKEELLKHFYVEKKYLHINEKDELIPVGKEEWRENIFINSPYVKVLREYESNYATVVLKNMKERKILINQNFTEFNFLVLKASEKGFFLTNIGLYEYVLTGELQDFDFPEWFQSPKSIRQIEDMLNFMAQI